MAKFFKQKLKKSRGFTLLEILLVVGIIAILAGIVIVAINPTRQLAQVRNTERKSDIKQIKSAVEQYYIDHNRYPTSITTTLKEICDTGNLSTTTGSEITCTNLIDLTSLVPTYLPAIPTDPQASTTNGAGYSILKDATNKLVLTAPQAELDQVVAIGTSTAVSAPPEEISDGITATCGGWLSSEDGYSICTFTTDGTFTVTEGGEVEILVVGGGGGSGHAGGGGGGAGGVVYGSYNIEAQSYEVIVGNGGVGATEWATTGSDGINSSFGTLIALGGGGGGGSYTESSGSANSGGSGGGAAGFTTGIGGEGIQPDSSSGGYGNDGGDCNTLASGGGGAGEAGHVAVITEDPPNIPGSHGGHGGDGISDVTLNGILASANAGVDVGGTRYIAGGGGAGSYFGYWGWGENGASGGTGGKGGGGNGPLPTALDNGTAGTPNTGGGGGGGGYDAGEGVGHDGGSGIVIVRYISND